MADEKNSKVERVVEPEVSNELSQVAASPSKSTLLAGAVVVVFLAIFYNMFIAGYLKDDKPAGPAKPADSEIVKPNADVGDLPAIPTLPEPKPIEATPITPSPAPTVPPVPLPIPVMPASPQLPTNVASDGILTGPTEDEQRRLEAKRRSPITVKDSAPPPQTEQPGVIKMQSLEYTLGRGKIIDAVLESAVNTDFGGEVRAIISRDIFSESGRVILIPKGSRIFGAYATGIGRLQSRIEIIWDRIDLASGYRLTLNAYGIDSLGRKGIEGQLDNKYKEKMTNAVLTSAFNILVAKGVDKLVVPVDSTQTAATAQANASNILATAASAYSDATKTAADMCTSIQNAITDKSSAAFTQASSQCTSINADATLNAQQKKDAVFALATTVSTSLSTAATKSTTPTKAQTAAEDAYKNVTDTLKGMVDQQKFDPTITIDQGKPIKIYVTKDYEFPPQAIFKSRVIK